MTEIFKKQTQAYVENRQSKLYMRYIAMKQRCINPNNKSYVNYGGRGIKVCDDWLNDYSKFQQWAYESGYIEELTLDRIDNDGDYSPNNCRWTDRQTQCINRRMFKNNTSGYIGVIFHKRLGRFQSSVRVNTVDMHIGTYKTAIEAAKARDKYVVEHNLPHTLNFK